MYVWFDALTNYISTLGWPENTENFEAFWKYGNPTQYCGKDNTRFQGVMWQAMLMAAGLPNSHQIIVNGFITGEGGIRMSKSLGNGVDPKEIVDEYGTDALRYFLLREVSSFEDSPFTVDRFKEAYNSGLANGLGNLTSRILTLSEKHLEEKVILPEYDYSDMKDNMEKFDIKLVMDLTWSFVRDLDEYIQKEEPFKVIKVDENAGKEHIRLLIQRLSIIAKRLIPMMPETAEKILHYININKKPEEPLFLRK
ncbi:MAG: class I tRNA ligase family protein, partial [Candidatus Pacebacteria bacterium]|nr:class I tRNA ligase family protein [Candidatus Paceibacterota bacterium]